MSVLICRLFKQLFVSRIQNIFISRWVCRPLGVECDSEAGTEFNLETRWIWKSQQRASGHQQASVKWSLSTWFCWLAAAAHTHTHTLVFRHFISPRLKTPEHNLLRDVPMILGSASNSSCNVLWTQDDELRNVCYCMSVSHHLTHSGTLQTPNTLTVNLPQPAAAMTVWTKYLASCLLHFSSLLKNGRSVGSVHILKLWTSVWAEDSGQSLLCVQQLSHPGTEAERDRGGIHNSLYKSTVVQL